MLWCCMKVSSCYILPCSGALLRSCSSSLSPLSLNWKKFLFWRPLLLCQVLLKLIDAFNLIHQWRTDGGMDEPRHFILKTFLSQKARLKGSLETGTRIQGAPSSQFSILTAQLLSCFWLMNMEALCAEQHSLYRREWECHLLPSQLSVSLVNLAGADVGLSLLRYWWEGGLISYLWRKASVKSFLK